MLDLGNMSMSSSVVLTCCPSFFPAASGMEFSKSIDSTVDDSAGDCNRNLTPMLPLPEEEVDIGTSNGNSGISAFIGKKKVKNWVKRRVDSGVSDSKCVLPFLVGAKKMVDCLVCRKPVYPGEKLACSVRGCEGVYHSLCAKESLGVSKKGKFKCPQHECFACDKKPPQWRCVRCPMAAHDKHAPWPEKIFHLKGQPGKAVCWRHPTDWRLDTKHAVAQSEIKVTRIQDVFCQLPLPYVKEEFKVDTTWKGPVAKDDVMPPYVHIRRNIYLVKKTRDDSYDEIGCTNCGPICCISCVCRNQCISCSKGCGCPETCSNRPFRKGKKIKIVKTEHCGWGVDAVESINERDFIIEYIGEVISDIQCEKRLWDMKHKGMNNFYMCEIQKDFTIDATFKGNASRFLNHSCNPNCILEKWLVEGEIRVGVFAARQIEAGEPLTYDYRFVLFGAKVKCNCGSNKCRGYLGTKKKEVKEVKEEANGMVVSWGAKRRRRRVRYLTEF